MQECSAEDVNVKLNVNLDPKSVKLKIAGFNSGGKRGFYSYFLHLVLFKIWSEENRTKTSHSLWFLKLLWKKGLGIIGVGL